MRLIFFASILLIPLLAEGQSRDEQAVASLSRRKFQWMINKNEDSLRNLVDERLQYIHSNGWVQNKHDLLEDLRSGKLNYQKVSVKESAVRIFPENSKGGQQTAIVTGTGTFEGVTEGKLFAMDLRYTEVYVRDQKNIWRLVSRHANRMP
ncbi:MAG: nuclear transport factor 2 family protein [Bacteroidetes bacterium]|nr:nuclear transport factor 2 family protein [Bacteroidota bacterium]